MEGAGHFKPHAERRDAIFCLAFLTGPHALRSSFVLEVPGVLPLAIAASDFSKYDGYRPPDVCTPEAHMDANPIRSAGAPNERRGLTHNGFRSSCRRRALHCCLIDQWWGRRTVYRKLRRAQRSGAFALPA